MKNENCPKCGASFRSKPIRCGNCNYVPETTKDEWKAANMGKQLGKPETNRDGKRPR